MVVLTVKAPSTAASPPPTHPLRVLSVGVGGREGAARTGGWTRHRPSVRQASSSEVVVLQEVGPLQHLHVALVDFQSGPEADGETGQYVAALHQEEGLPVNFLHRRKK